MSDTTTTSWASRITQQLNATKGTLRDAVEDTNLTTRLTEVEARIIERDAFEILSRIRSWRNGFAPVNKIPPEIFNTLPDFLESWEKDRTLIALTHVCRAWREVFVSRPSLWTDLRWERAEKTFAYLERSKTSPVNVSVCRYGQLSLQDPFLQVIPRITGRLKSLSIDGVSEYLIDVAAYLSNPEPLLESLNIDIRIRSPDRGPAHLPPILAGDFSSLHNLRLSGVRTKLPWRNMVNLTSLSFGLLPPDSPSIGQLLDFFQSAPRIREIGLLHTTPILGGQDGRLISLASLEKMVINGYNSCVPLLNHLLIPVGAKLRAVSKPTDSDYEHHFPRSLDNLKNLSNFTTVNLGFNSSHSEFQFIGPNGELTIIFKMCRVEISAILDYVARFDSSKVEQLRIVGSGSPDPNVVRRAFLPMQNLRTLTLRKYKDQHAIVHALASQSQTSSVLLCPELEELALCPEEGEEKSAIQTLAAMAASRALRGAMLKTVRILKSRDKFDPEDVLELGNYALEVVFDP